MNIENILKLVRSGDLDIAEAKRLLEEQAASSPQPPERSAGGLHTNGGGAASASSEAEAQGIDDTLGYAQLDLHRAKRTGFPEVIFGEGKTAEQIASIFERLMAHSDRVLATRVSPDKAAHVLERVPGAVHHADARAIAWTREDAAMAADGYIAVVCAGTSDLPVAEEAAVTAECMGVRAERVYDVGVAGIHRLFRRLPVIRGARAIVVAAGMEGALASVLGGLVSVPVIAVPTSIGYGASFHGLAALLAMLNSCAPGISVVNIDNGFGAGYNAALIYKNSKSSAGLDAGKEG